MRAAILVLLVACSAGRQAAMAPMAETRPVMPADPHARISELEGKIREQSAAMGLQAPPPCENCSVAEPMSVHAAADPSCHPAQNDTCTQSCTISDSICDNADQICNVANELPGDQWAADHCATAKQVCKAAHAKCCACM